MAYREPDCGPDGWEDREWWADWWEWVDDELERQEQVAAWLGIEAEPVWDFAERVIP